MCFLKLSGSEGLQSLGNLLAAALVLKEGSLSVLLALANWLGAAGGESTAGGGGQVVLHHQFRKHSSTSFPMIRSIESVFFATHAFSQSRFESFKIFRASFTSGRRCSVSNCLGFGICCVFPSYAFSRRWLTITGLCVGMPVSLRVWVLDSAVMAAAAVLFNRTASILLKPSPPVQVGSALFIATAQSVQSPWLVAS